MPSSVTVVGLSSRQVGETIAKLVQRTTIDVAMSTLRSRVAKGFDRQPVVVTDGVTRRDPNQVKPYGRIEFIGRQSYAEIVTWMLNELWKRSPIKSRRYINHHIVMLNGVSLGANMSATLRAAKPGDRIQIVNTMPYAKKIEGRPANRKRGISGMQGQSRQAPNGVYRQVLRLAVQRYGKSIFVDYKFIKLDTGVKVMGFVGGKSGGGAMKHGDRKRVLRAAVFPCLQIFIKPTGLLN